MIGYHVYQLECEPGQMTKIEYELRTCGWHTYNDSRSRVYVHTYKRPFTRYTEDGEGLMPGVISFERVCKCKWFDDDARYNGDGKRSSEYAGRRCRIKGKKGITFTVRDVRFPCEETEKDKRPNVALIPEDQDKHGSLWMARLDLVEFLESAS